VFSSIVFECAILEHISRHFKPTLNISQPGFAKPESTTTSLVTIVETVSATLSSKGQFGSICLDHISAFDFALHSWLLGKISSDGLCTAYVDWSRNHLTNEVCFVRPSGVSSSSFIVLSDVPQGSVLGYLLFNKCINDLCRKIKHSCFPLFANYINNFLHITSMIPDFFCSAVYRQPYEA
jgi:hypothetical protein